MFCLQRSAAQHSTRCFAGSPGMQLCICFTQQNIMKHAPVYSHPAIPRASVTLSLSRPPTHSLTYPSHPRGSANFLTYSLIPSLRHLIARLLTSLLALQLLYGLACLSMHLPSKPLTAFPCHMQVKLVQVCYMLYVGAGCRRLVSHRRHRRADGGGLTTDH